MAQEQRDVTELLTEDHRNVEEIFSQLERLPEGDHEERRRLTDHVIIDLVRHSVAEEQHLYPAARRYVPDGDEIVDREIAEHQEAEQLMKRLEGGDATQPEFSQTLTELMRAIHQHVREEEGDLFPRLRQHADRDALIELGRKVEQAMQSAPTRPHPSAPQDRPGLLKVLAPGAGLVDRARDAVTGRGK